MKLIGLPRLSMTCSQSSAPKRRPNHTLTGQGRRARKEKGRLPGTRRSTYINPHIDFGYFGKPSMKFARSSLIPFSMPSKHAVTPETERSSSLKSPFMDLKRKKRSEQREPNRLLRMQDPFPSSFSKEKGRCCSCRPIARAHALISPPPSRPSGRSSSPSVSRSCARGQPWSSRAWRPSPPSIVAHGPSRPWHGESVKL